jgi:HpcH/HpaI aldolase/citrate lyase family
MKLGMLATLVIANLTTVQREAQPSAAIELWTAGRVAFGVFVPNDEPARAAAYANPLYDFLFLNLEPRYDSDTVRTVVAGLQGTKMSGRKTLIVRIPTIERDGADAAHTRIKEAFGLGADGVAVPHVRGVDEAKQALGFFRDAKVNIWSPSNRTGDKLAMLLLEDPAAVERAEDVAKMSSYSILACGIGSLTQALGGNREAAEAGNQRVLAQTKRANLVNMTTTTRRDVEQRVSQGFLALIAIGAGADDTIAAGRKAAGR